MRLGRRSPESTLKYQPGCRRVLKSPPRCLAVTNRSRPEHAPVSAAVDETAAALAQPLRAADATWGCGPLQAEHDAGPSISGVAHGCCWTGCLNVRGHVAA